MADDAFALSPLNARASLPSEADYAAICDAFMETSRGRWFLNEYTRRNRNADTQMVLEAVSRLESTLAQQKQTPNPLIDLLPKLIETVTQTRLQVAEMAVAPDDGSLAAIQRRTKTICDVAWALRECGADTRICDLLDMQVKGIDEGREAVLNTQLRHDQMRANVLAAFDAMAQQIRALVSDDEDLAAPEAEFANPAQDASAGPTFSTSQASSEDRLLPEIALTATDISEDRSLSNDAARNDYEIDLASEPEAQDTALAYEAEPLPSSDTENAVASPKIGPADIAVTDLESAPLLTTQDIASKAGPSNAALPADNDSHAQSHSAALNDLVAVPTDASVDPHATLEPISSASISSLGHAILDNGIVPHPHTARPDPLALISRMSQAERIALFT